MAAGVGLNGQINVFKSLSPVLSQVVSWYGCFVVVFFPPDQCLSNLFLNYVFTFGAFTTKSGNSFHTLVILTGKDCRLKFNFEPS